MNKQKKNKWFLYLKNNLFINFCFSFNILIIFSFFKEYKNENQILKFPLSITLLNGNIFVIYEEGIKIYDSKLNNSNTILNFSDGEKINDKAIHSKIAISRFSEDNYGYIISVISNKLYIFDCEGNKLFKNEISLNGNYYSIVPIKEENKEFTYMIGFIDSGNKVNYYFYKYDNNSNINEQLYYYNSNNYQTEDNIFSCQLMNYLDDIIVCFVQNTISDKKAINYFFIEPNNYNISNTIESNHFQLQSNIKNLKSVVSSDKKQCLICFNDANGNTYYLIYSINNNSFSQSNLYSFICRGVYEGINFYYMRETEEFLFFCINNNKEINLALFDKNLNHKQNYINYNNDIDGGFSIIYSYELKDYYLMSCCMQDSHNYIQFSPNIAINKTLDPIMDIIAYIENITQKTEINLSTMNSTNTYSIIISTQPIIITTLPTLPTTILTKSTIISTESTIITTLPTIITVESTLITTLPTTILNKSTILESLPTTITPESTIITTLPTTITIESTLITTLPTTITIESTIITTLPTTVTIESTIITTLPTTITIESTIIRTLPTIVTTESTKSSIITNEANLFASSTIIYINTSIPTSILTSTSISMTSSTSTISSSIIDSSFNILEEKIEIKKEEIMNELPSIMKDIEIGQIYKKIGEDYSIFIYPTNSTYLTSITHVNFTECEKVLRKHYEIPDSTIMTFLQIEIENNDSKSLINQVEYQAYDGNKTLLDLSICDDINIQVIHSIKNKSLIDLDTANYFKQSGIDIFNINDSFFNDICEPYSDSDDDLILEDRIRDIYQNYSLCEDGCSYDKIDLDNLTISCECKVKDNISTVITPINVEHSEGSSTNFELIKCYNLVFSSDGKLNNIGFIIFTILVSAHIPILIYYFMKGVKPVREYIINEMKKYGYIKNNIKNKNNEKNNKNKRKRKIKNKTNDNILTKKSISFNDGPPKRKNKNNKNENKNDKNVIIKNLKIIDNSSSLNILKSNKKDVIPKINKKKLKINTIKESKNSIIKSSTKNKDIINTTTKKIIANLPTQTKNNIEENINDKKEKKIFKEFNLINMDLNLHRNKKYIPPDSNVILNNYTFQEALKYEDRQICEIFYIFVLSKQIFFHTFLYRSPVELFSLRLCLFIFIFSCDLALNSLFYFNDNISKKYRSSKNLFIFTFSDNIAVIILSTIVGFILLTLLAKLSNSTNAIREVFRKEEEKLKSDKNYNITEKRKNEILLEIDEILNKYKCKIIILITIEMILMIFFWYFVTAFCHVYKATQLSWLLDSFISILFRAIIELLISFGLAKLYKVAIAGESPCLYKFVMFMYNFS